MSKEIDTMVDALLASFSVSYSVVYRGVKKNALGGKTSMDQWAVEFTHTSRPMEPQEFDFFTGMGHREPATKQQKQEASYGFQGLTDSDRKGLTMYGKRYLAKVESMRKPVPPTAASVLHSMLLEMEASYTSFRNWCNDFGYDDDSISAKKTYDACQETAHKMEKIFNNEQLDQLREALQDY